MRSAPSPLQARGPHRGGFRVEALNHWTKGLSAPFAAYDAGNLNNTCLDYPRGAEAGEPPNHAFGRAHVCICVCVVSISGRLCTVCLHGRRPLDSNGARFSCSLLCACTDHRKKERAWKLLFCAFPLLYLLAECLPVETMQVVFKVSKAKRN